MRPTADVVVVGGGIIGCATARELAAAGLSVVLVERGEIAAAASGRNHGLLFRPEDPALGPLYQRSVEAYQALSTAKDIDLMLDAEPVGLLVVVPDESRWPAAEREATALAMGGSAIDRLDADQVREAEPSLAPGLLGGFLIHDGLRVDPAALTLTLALEARRAGAELMTHTDVKQVLASRSRVRGVATDEGIVSAPVVVDAAGPWAAKVARSAGADLPIGGIRGWILLTDPLPGLLNHVVEAAGWHMPAGDGGPGRSTVAGVAAGTSVRRDVGTLVQQNRGGHILLGGSRIGSLTEDPEDQAAVAEIARGATALVPRLGALPVVATWSGVRPTSPDGCPLIGWVPGVEGLLIAGGHGGQGVALGAGSGLLAAQLVRGGGGFTDTGIFDPARFGDD